MSIRRITIIPLFTALMIVFTIVFPKIPVPIININVTLQTFIVILAGLLLCPIDAFTSMLLYVLIGALGFPVFSGLSGGIGWVLGPNGGFILSFPIVAFLISLFKIGKQTMIKNMMLSIFFGIMWTYLIGSIWLSFYSKLNFTEIMYGMLIFLPTDVLKCIFASIISLKVKDKLTMIRYYNLRTQNYY